MKTDTKLLVIFIVIMLGNISASIHHVQIQKLVKGMSMECTHAEDVSIEDEYVYMDVSAYCPCEICCGRFSDGITASGKPAKGFLVAAPPNLPFGTRLSIPCYNNGLPVEVQDRGGAIKGNKLDLLFATHQEALDWGRKTLKVRILK